MQLLRWVGPEHFTRPALGWIFSALRDYWHTYNARPTDLYLRDAVARLDEHRRIRYQTEVAQVISLGGVAEREWIKHRLGEWTRQALFAEAHARSAQLFNEGKTVDAYDATMRALERIQEVTFDTPDRSYFFEELPERQRKRIRDDMNVLGGRFTTGVRELDMLTDGGVHPGELWTVFAYAKRGKTSWLINQGFNACRVHRQPVLHFVLEGKTSQTTARYDTRFSGELYRHVKRGDIDPRLYAELQAEYRELRGLLVIRTLNDWNVTILDVQQELHVQRGRGFRPAMIVLDYMDLGRSRDKVDSERQHQIDFARDFKRLVINEEIAGWSAWQATRPSPGAHKREHLLTSGNVADAYAKVRIVDAWGSLNATDAEMDQGRMRLFWEGHRDAPVNRVWEITNDLERMKMAITSVPWEEPAAETA